MSEERKLKRRKRDTTRELLLAAGVLLADAYAMSDSDELGGNALGHLRFDEVLEVATRLQVFIESAGGHPDDVSFDVLGFGREHAAEVLATDIGHVKAISRGSAYFAFDDEADYRVKLAAYRLRGDRSDDLRAMSRAAARSDESGDPKGFSDAVGAAVAALCDRWRTRSAGVLDLAMAQFGLSPSVGTELEQAFLRQRNGDDGEGGLSALVVSLLERHHRRMRSGFQPDDLATALLCVAYGFTFGQRAAPSAAGRKRGDRRRTLVAAAAAGVAEEMTEPAPSG